MTGSRNVQDRQVVGAQQDTDLVDAQVHGRLLGRHSSNTPTRLDTAGQAGQAGRRVPPNEDETKVDERLVPVEPIWTVEPAQPQRNLASRLLADAPELGVYLVERELARGGQGAVFLARDRRSQQQVAIKVLLDGREPEARIRFMREATLLNRIRHPHLPRVLAHGPCRAGAFIVMEFVAGCDLKRLVEQGGVPDFAWTARTLASVAAALHHAHQFGVVHRDVKPQNVVLERTTRPVSLDRGSDFVAERAVLVDFGLAKRVQAKGTSPWTTWEPLTAEGALLGTPAFMAPEQAGAEEVGPAADVYGLGATLFFLVTGKAPHQGATSLAQLYALYSRSFGTPRQLNPAVPAELDAICMKAMGLTPAERHGSAKELADQLAAFADKIGRTPRPSKLS